MFGVGPQEMVVIGILLLIVFGPSKLPGMARDVGRFVSQARRYKDEFQSELVSGPEDEPPEHEKTFNLSIKEGVMSPSEVAVDEGDEVTLWITSDSPIQVFLNGYDFSARVESGTPLRVPFDATTTGRFEIENHDTEAVLGELIVRPR